MPWESRVVPAKSGELSTKQQETTILIMFDCLINFDPLSIYATFVERIWTAPSENFTFVAPKLASNEIKCQA